MKDSSSNNYRTMRVRLNTILRWRRKNALLARYCWVRWECRFEKFCMREAHHHKRLHLMFAGMPNSIPFGKSPVWGKSHEWRDVCYVNFMSIPVPPPPTTAGSRNRQWNSNSFASVEEEADIRGFPLRTSGKISDFLTPSLVRKFTQPPLLRLLTMSAFEGTPPVQTS